MNSHHCEEKLLEAIETGQLDQVKQLLSSGLDLNTVLHSRVRRESATILAVAAYEGQLAIIQHLVDSGVCMNYQEPCKERSALHWACIGGKTDAAKLLLEHQIDVNTKDRDNVTPLIYAAAYGPLPLVSLLISYGANVLAVDRLHSSALHYGSFHGKRDIVTTLIKAGSIANNPVLFGEGTPLANLVFHGDENNVRLLIEAGYDLKLDTWIPGISSAQKVFDPNYNRHIIGWLLKEYRSPPPLYRLCCSSLRKQAKGVRVQQKLSKLPLPLRVINDLTLEKVCSAE